MSISSFPPVGTDTWTEVATASPTSGSTVALSGLPAANKFRIVGFNITSSADANWQLTINNDSSTSYLTSYDNSGTPNNSSIDVAGFSNRSSFDLTFTAANQTIYKNASGFAPSSSASFSDPRNNFNATWANTAVITRFDLTLSTGTFTSGTIKVFAA